MFDNWHTCLGNDSIIGKILKAALKQQSKSIIALSQQNRRKGGRVVPFLTLKNPTFLQSSTKLEKRNSQR